MNASRGPASGPSPLAPGMGPTPLLPGVTRAREAVTDAWRESKRQGFRKDYVHGLMQAVMVLERLERHVAMPDRHVGFTS